MSAPTTRSAALEVARQRAVQQRDELADLYLAAFSTPAGQRVLLDLEALVHQPCLPPTASEAELRDLNGQKRLFGIIMERIEHGRRERQRRAAGDGSAGGG
ncbi:hypothetical protein M0638_12570 [Roseomonas sp. NAR14]|uniref:Bbp19-like phage domain-containing protein n=1 Tax=Roseomonas acroporae TaxID=2937791 RepID=A0A9X2BWR5_9PROT|nr:hypothetical protein [Roseomonas acroporae]MCK8785219.1 hypothetical protein [Roseomonas acroporae]